MAEKNSYLYVKPALKTESLITRAAALELDDSPLMALHYAHSALQGALMALELEVCELILKEARSELLGCHVYPTACRLITSALPAFLCYWLGVCWLSHGLR